MHRVEVLVPALYQLFVIPDQLEDIKLPESVIPQRVDNVVEAVPVVYTQLHAHVLPNLRIDQLGGDSAMLQSLFRQTIINHCLVNFLGGDGRR